MFLDRDDIIKFEALKKHYDPIATNIGIIGDREYVEKKIKSIIKATPHNLLIQNESKLCYRLMLDDKETTYYGIQQLDDLDNLYFRKYI